MEQEQTPKQVQPEDTETIQIEERGAKREFNNPDISGLSVALKTNLGPGDVTSPPTTISPGLQLLTQKVETLHDIHSC